MKRTHWTAVLAAGVLLVAGCSSTSAGTGGAASTTAESSSSSSEAASSEAMTSESSSTGASAAPAALDEQTTTWFTTFCGGLAPLGELADLDTSGQDAATAQKTGVAALQQFGATLSATSETLKSTPPPTFEGGKEFASQVSSGLAESGPKIAALAQSFGAVNPSDTAAFEKAASELVGSLSSAITPLQQLGKLPPDVSAAIEEIPACKALGA